MRTKIILGILLYVLCFFAAFVGAASLIDSIWVSHSVGIGLSFFGYGGLVVGVGWGFLSAIRPVKSGTVVSRTKKERLQAPSEYSIVIREDKSDRTREIELDPEDYYRCTTGSKYPDAVMNNQALT